MRGVDRRIDSSSNNDMEDSNRRDSGGARTKSYEGSINVDCIITPG